METHTRVLPLGSMVSDDGKAPELHIQDRFSYVEERSDDIVS